MNTKTNLWKKCIWMLFLAGIVIGLFVLVSNLTMLYTQGKKIVTLEEAKEHKAQCIFILGCGVWSGNRPSSMLQDRLEEGIRLYEAGVAPKILVSGDHGRENYDEVNVMKNYLMDAGIPNEDIFMDHAGFSTYESVVRAKKIFQVERMIIVTQKYHLYRALYISSQQGIEAVGVNSDPRAYRGAFYRSAREWIARDKDIFSCLFHVKPTYLGDVYDITGDGSVTND